MMENKRVQIGIVGAGIAGLVNGLELQRAGHAVSIYEARSRCGGRIKSIMLDGMLVECGPEFIHGELKETIRLLKRYDIPFVAIDGKMYRYASGQLTETFEMAKGWKELLLKMKSVATDMPFQNFLEKYFPGKRFSELRRSAIRFAEGFDLADTKTCSTTALVEEWEGEEGEQYRIPAGYGTLIRAIENEFREIGGRIYLDHPVESIDWSLDKISIYSKGNQKTELDKLVVCLPLSIFSDKDPAVESIVFLPAITEKKVAMAEIGFGTVIKIVMIWEKAFWKSIVPEAQFILSDEFIPTWWTQYPLDLPMLTGWMGGPKALEFADATDDFLRGKAIESLASIFSTDVENIKKGMKECRVFNWKKTRWSRGAYSYAKVGYQTAKVIAKKTLNKQIYFSGEAYYEGAFPGTVESAVVDALNTAKLILMEI
jgi:monoamine oxidase